MRTPETAQRLRSLDPRRRRHQDVCVGNWLLGVLEGEEVVKPERIKLSYFATGITEWGISG